jgi:hypothetical protein
LRREEPIGGNHGPLPGRAGQVRTSTIGRRVLWQSLCRRTGPKFHVMRYQQTRTIRHAQSHNQGAPGQVSHPRHFSRGIAADQMNRRHDLRGGVIPRMQPSSPSSPSTSFLIVSRVQTPIPSAKTSQPDAYDEQWPLIHCYPTDTLPHPRSPSVPSQTPDSTRSRAANEHSRTRPRYFASRASYHSRPEIPPRPDHQSQIPPPPWLANFATDKLSLHHSQRSAISHALEFHSWAF